MHIQSVSYQNFRNFQSLDLGLSQGFMILAGPNGAGKTNFLEGIYFGGSLRKFSESKFSQLLQTGHAFFKIGIESQNTESQKQEVYVEQRDSKYFYKFKYNNHEVSRNQYAGKLPIISFLPQDLSLLTRSPGTRRLFLNETLSMVSEQYRYIYQQYEKTLRQRNELLQKIKTKVARPLEIEVWDEKLAEFGSSITNFRKFFLEYLNSHFGLVMNVLSPNLAEAKFIYHPSAEANKPEFLKRLRQLRAKEQDVGVTLIGPHRDDFKVVIGQQEIAGFASRGQVRSVTLALKILEKQYLQTQLSLSPVLLLDDIFSEFDKQHQEKLAEFLQALEQVFVTTTHLEEVEEFLPKDAQIFNIEKGRLFAASAPHEKTL